MLMLVSFPVARSLYYSSILRTQLAARILNVRATNAQSVFGFYRCTGAHMVTINDLDHIFTYHAPTPEQLPLYENIRSAGRNLAEVILNSTIPCADQQAAIRHVREAVMTANAAVALR